MHPYSIFLSVSEQMHKYQNKILYCHVNRLKNKLRDYLAILFNKNVVILFSNKNDLAL